MRRAARTDDNQTAVVKTLRSLGFSVAITSMVGEGFPDIALAKNGLTRLAEIKDGTKPPSARQLTNAEQIFYDTWKDAVLIIESVDDCLWLNKHWGNSFAILNPPPPLVVAEVRNDSYLHAATAS